MSQITLGCKRKEDNTSQSDQLPTPKKPRLVFTDLQRRTLQAIFKVSEIKQMCNLIGNVVLLKGNKEAVERNASNNREAVGPGADNSR